MDENTVHKPLLLSPSAEPESVKQASFAASLAKLILRVVIWVIFIVWVAITFLFPAEFTSKFVRKLLEATGGTFFGITGLRLSYTPFFIIIIIVIFFIKSQVKCYLLTDII